MTIDDFDRFPESSYGVKNEVNPAIRAFGLRFVRNQTPLEYLAEFLLAYASPKGSKDGDTQPGFPEVQDTSTGLVYLPKSRLPLKLFSFFPSSKLETRHPAHVERFRQLVKDVEAAITPAEGGSSTEAVQVLQQLFAGFVGVSGQRTWATHSFVPASRFLLSCEVDWRHTLAMNEKGFSDTDWPHYKKFFTTTSHNFMARGGEVLFLQLWHLTTCLDFSEMATGVCYAHVKCERLLERVDCGLGQLIDKIDEPLDQLGRFIERVAAEEPQIEDPADTANFGWIYRGSWREATLFAWEIANVCGSSSHDPLRKLRMLQDLCCLHVLRSICFQAVRLSDDAVTTQGFVGGYAWIVSPPDASGMDIAKASRASLQETENLLFRALRSPKLPGGIPPDPQKGDDDAGGLFRSLGKKLGIIIPRTGPGARFTLNSRIIEALVAALIEPGSRIRTDEFLRRIYAHYGMAVGADEITMAVNAAGGRLRFSPANDCSAWLEEDLQRGGLLIPLSDAVSMVVNPTAEGSDQ